MAIYFKIVFKFAVKNDFSPKRERNFITICIGSFKVMLMKGS